MGIPRLHRFLVADWTTQRGTIGLPEGEAHHARVLRLGDGEQIEIFDGCGASCTARFAPPASARLVEQLPDRLRESAVRVTLAVPTLKKDRFEWLIEKATELGVHRIIVVPTERSVANPSDRRRQRWRQTAIAAAKQSGRTVVPEIDEAGSLTAALAGRYDARILLDDSDHGLAEVLVALATASAILLIVGPEGGFTDAEIEQSRKSGAVPASLGPRTLRAETAAITAVAFAVNPPPLTSTGQQRNTSPLPTGECQGEGK